MRNKGGARAADGVDSYGDAPASAIPDERPQTAARPKTGSGGGAPRR